MLCGVVAPLQHVGLSGSQVGAHSLGWQLSPYRLTRTFEPAPFCCPHCARHFVYGCLSLKPHRRSRCQNLSLVCVTFAKPSLGFHLHLRCSTHAYVLWGPDLQHCQWTLKAAFLTSAATGTSTSITEMPDDDATDPAELGLPANFSLFGRSRPIGNACKKVRNSTKSCRFQTLNE